MSPLLAPRNSEKREIKTVKLNHERCSRNDMLIIFSTTLALESALTRVGEPPLGTNKAKKPTGTDGHCECMHALVVSFALSRPPSHRIPLCKPMLHERASICLSSHSRGTPPFRDLVYYKLFKVILKQIYDSFWPIHLVRVSPTMDYRLYGVKW